VFSTASMATFLSDSTYTIPSATMSESAPTNHASPDVRGASSAQATTETTTQTGTDMKPPSLPPFLRQSRPGRYFCSPLQHAEHVANHLPQTSAGYSSTWNGSNGIDWHKAYERRIHRLSGRESVEKKSQNGTDT
jgi:hypothetical protein